MLAPAVEVLWTWGSAWTALFYSAAASTPKTEATQTSVSFQRPRRSPDGWPMRHFWGQSGYFPAGEPAASGPLLLNQKTLGSCLCQGQHAELEGALGIPPPSPGEEPESQGGEVAWIVSNWHFGENSWLPHKGTVHPLSHLIHDTSRGERSSYCHHFCYLEIRKLWLLSKVKYSPRRTEGRAWSQQVWTGSPIPAPHLSTVRWVCPLPCHIRPVAENSAQMMLMTHVVLSF